MSIATNLVMHTHLMFGYDDSNVMTVGLRGEVWGGPCVEQDRKDTQV